MEVHGNNDILRELHIELRSAITTDAMLSVLEAKLVNDTPAMADTVILVLAKVLAKVVASRVPAEWTRF